MNSGDTAWVLVSSALVLLMTVGLACFYSGLVRSKNSLNTMMMSIVAMGAISVQWVLVGYSLSFAPGSAWLGGLDWVLFHDVGGDPNPAYAETIPQQAHAIYQAMFAIITPALISGAIVERMRFRAYLAFLVLWSTFVYAPLAHWVWGAGGWLQKMGALDFAGGTVVHISAGVSALVAVSRPAARFPARADLPAQRARGPNRRGSALVRVVRIQRRVRAGGECPRGARVCEHEHRRRGRAGHVGSA